MNDLIMSRDIPLSLIDADPDQPRRHFADDALAELAGSLQQNGQAVPVLVRPVGDRFVLVHGERRLRAARTLGWETIRAEVRHVAPDEARWLQLVENVQRADLTPIEEARAYQARLAAGMTQEALGRRIGKSQSVIAQKLRLLSLPSPVLLYLERGALGEGHARQLLRLRAMYAEMMVTFADDELAAWPESFDLGKDTEIMMFFNFLRLEDQPIGGFLPRDERERRLFGDAIAALRSDVAIAGGTIPLWHLAAFWRASHAVAWDMTVSTSARVIDRWHHRFISALATWYVEFGQQVPEGETPVERLNRLLYFGYHADLRHGRVLDYVQQHGLPRALEIEVTEAAAKIEHLAVPTLFQRWGEDHEQYQKLLSRCEGVPA